MKVNGEKGIAEVRSVVRATSARHRTGEQMTTKLISLTYRARRNPKSKFNSLMHILNERFLRESFWALKRDKSPGIDGKTVAVYEAEIEGNLKALVKRLKGKQYRPQPVKRAYIPKSDGTERGLGIPTVEDKVVQMGVKRILEAIYEEEFKDVSYGFRLGRGCHGALAAVNETIMGKSVNYVVDMDIKKFFDTISHEKLMKCLREKISDTSLLRLIQKFLKAGVMEEGQYIETEKGTPQGGVISPILANIYLHYALDLWFEQEVKKRIKGYSQLIRYADDFIVCFQREHEAKAFGVKLKERLAEFELKIAEEKSRIIEFGRFIWEKAKQAKRKVNIFNFLGITHYCSSNKEGKYKLGRKTERARYWQKIKAINLWIKGVRNLIKLKDWWKLLRQKLTGHYRYYGIGGNMTMISMFYQEVVKLAYKWINRRSQKRSYTWAQFTKFLKYNPLPKPMIYHPYPIISRRMHN